MLMPASRPDVRLIAVFPPRDAQDIEADKTEFYWVPEWSGNVRNVEKKETRFVITTYHLRELVRMADAARSAGELSRADGLLEAERFIRNVLKAEEVTP